MAGGRPRKYSNEQVSALLEKFNKYIDNADVPIIAEFAYQNGVLRETIYDYEEFSTLRKRCIDKKEAQLERLALDGLIDKTMAIFSLKQLGWSDKQRVEHAGDPAAPVTLVYQPVAAPDYGEGDTESTS